MFGNVQNKKCLNFVKTFLILDFPTTGRQGITLGIPSLPKRVVLWPTLGLLLGARMTFDTPYSPAHG